MRVLLIGGTGFIGPHVIRQLKRLGHEIVLFHRDNQKKLYPEAEHILGDRNRLSEYAPALRKAQPDVVVDFVLSSGRQARDFMSLFSGVARRVIALSSGDVYRAIGIFHRLEEGPIERVPLTEDSPLRTRLQTYPPAAVKKLQSVLPWLDEEYDKIPVERAVLADPAMLGTILRLPFVYGPGDYLHRLFPIVKRIEDGRKMILLDEQVAQWRASRGYVENVALAIVAAITDERAAGRIYNVAETQVFSELEWTQRVTEAAGWKGEIRVVPSNIAPDHLKVPSRLEQHWTTDTSRIRNELDYRETVPLEEALRRTIEWERVNPPQEVDPKRFDYEAEDRCVAFYAS